MPDGDADEDADFLASLDHLVADAVAEAAALERSQTRMLRGIAEEEATFVGLAVDLAERGTAVVARTSSGRSHRGRIVAVGRDFVVVRSSVGAWPPGLGGAGSGPGPGTGAGRHGPAAFLPLWSLAILRPDPDSAAVDASGARRPPLTVGLAALLSRLAADRPRVQVGLVGDEPIAGELRSAGTDVLTLRLDGDAGLRAHVRLGALAEVVLLDR